jgi:hypothetical protein
MANPPCDAASLTLTLQMIEARLADGVNGQGIVNGIMGALAELVSNLSVAGGWTDEEAEERWIELTASGNNFIKHRRVFYERMYSETEGKALH